MKKAFVRALCVLFAVSMVLLCACGQAPAAPSSAAAPPPSADPASTPASTGGEAGHEPVTLRIYVRYSDADTMEPYDYMVEELAKDMPWVTLELDPKAADDNVKIKSYAATGDMPDIFDISGLDVIDTLKTSGNIADVSDIVTANGFVDKVLPGALPKLYYPGTEEIYTLPYMGAEVALLYVNQELFTANDIKIPETIEELKTAAAAFSDLGIAPLSIFAMEQWICFQFCDMIASRYVPQGFTAIELGTATIDDPGYLQAAQDVVDLAAAGMFPVGSTNVNYEQATELWYNDRCAMFLNGQWEIPASTERLGDKATWIPAPAKDAESIEASRYDFSGGWGSPSGLCVSPNSENYETAVEVACYVAQKFSEYDYVYRGEPTVGVQVDKPAEVELTPMMQTLSEYQPKMTNNSLMGALSDPTLNTTVLEECQRLIAGTSTAEEFVANIKRITG